MNFILSALQHDYMYIRYREFTKIRIIIVIIDKFLFSVLNIFYFSTSKIVLQNYNKNLTLQIKLIYL